MRGERSRYSPERQERSRHSPERSRYSTERSRRYSPEHRYRRRETVDEFGRSVQRSVEPDAPYDSYDDRPARRQRRSASPRDTMSDNRRDGEREYCRDDVSLFLFSLLPV